jgi:hypothetical protein
MNATGRPSCASVIMYVSAGAYFCETREAPLQKTIWEILLIVSLAVWSCCERGWPRFTVGVELRKNIQRSRGRNKKVVHTKPNTRRAFIRKSLPETKNGTIVQASLATYSINLEKSRFPQWRDFLTFVTFLNRGGNLPVTKKNSIFLR